MKIGDRIFWREKQKIMVITNILEVDCNLPGRRNKRV